MNHLGQVPAALFPFPCWPRSNGPRPIPPPCSGCGSESSGMLLGVSSERSRGPLGSSLGASWEPLGGLLGLPGGLLGASWGLPGGLLGASWALLGASWALLGNIGLGPYRGLQQYDARRRWGGPWAVGRRGRDVAPRRFVAKRNHRRFRWGIVVSFAVWPPSPFASAEGASSSHSPAPSPSLHLPPLPDPPLSLYVFVRTRHGPTLRRSSLFARRRRSAGPKPLA